MGGEVALNVALANPQRVAGLILIDSAGVEVPGHLLAGGDDVAHVRIFGFAQRGGDTDVDGVQLEHGREIGGGAEFPGFHQRAEDGAGNVPDIGIARVDAPDLLFGDVDSGDGETGLGEFDGKGEAYVSETDDSDARPAAADLFSQNFRGGCGG